MNILFICNAGKNRSRTGAELWKKAHPEDVVKHLGINAVSMDVLRWSNKIIVFEDRLWKKVLEIAFDDIKVYLKLKLWGYSRHL